LGRSSLAGFAERLVPWGGRGIIWAVVAQQAPADQSINLLLVTRLLRDEG